MAIFRLAVTGGRNYADQQIVWTMLDIWLDNKGRLILIHGDCPTGLDKFASDWSRSKERAVKVWEIRCPADWNDPFLKRVGMAKVAGNARNGDMLREFRPDILLAWPGGSGTADCIAQAKAIGIEVKDFEYLKDLWK